MSQGDLDRLRHAQRDAALPSDTSGGLDRLDALLSGQEEVFELIARGAETGAVLARVARLVEALIPGAACAIHLVETGAATLTYGAAPSLPDDYREATARIPVGPDGHPCGRAAWKGEAVALRDLSAEAGDENLSALASRHGLRSLFCHPVASADGEPLGLIALYFTEVHALDLLERRIGRSTIALIRMVIGSARRDAALKSADEQRLSLAASIPGVVYQRRVGPEGNIAYTYISEGARDLFGVPAEEILAAPQIQFDRPEHRARFRDRLLEASRNLEFWDVEAQIITSDGEEKWTHDIARPHPQADGSVLWNGVILDATHRKQAELALRKANIDTETASRIQSSLVERLRAANERLSSLAASVPGVVYQRRVMRDGAIRYTYISEGARDLTGVSPEEILENPEALFQCHDPDHRATFPRRLLEASRGLTMWDVEARIVTRSGDEKWIHEIARPHREPDGSVLWDGVILDTTRVKTAEIGAAAAAARTQKIVVESISQGVILFDPDDRVVLCNSNYLDLYPGSKNVVVPGALFEDVMRREIEQLAPMSDKPRERALARRLESHRRSGHTAEQRLSSDRWILASESRTQDGSTIILYTDISDLKRREKQLEAARDEAQAANNAKSEFLANMSHELRTPLNAIIGFSEMMRDGVFGPLGDRRYGNYAADIHHSGCHLLGLINDILDLSKVEAGHLALNETAVDLGGVIEACRRLINGPVRDAGLTLAITCQADLPKIRGDDLKLRQILLNLLSNAVKFTPPGGRVALQARRSADGGIEIAVSDSGIGIKPKDLSRILEPFQQVASTMARKHQGTGLGLPLANGLIDLHDGELGLTSAAGQGTTATVRLPASRIIRSDG